MLSKKSEFQSAVSTVSSRISAINMTLELNSAYSGAKFISTQAVIYEKFQYSFLTDITSKNNKTKTG